MRMTGTEEAIPVGILTGFLGSGKTTVLRRILEAEEFGDSAVLINEFGEVGLDHILVGEIAPDVVLLNSGCLCCILRGELRDALSSLLTDRARGAVPAFKRVIIETTGIAQPSHIVSTILADPEIRHHYRVGDIVTTVDAMHALVQLQEGGVWLEQVACANDLLLTKSDCVSADQLIAVKKFVERINPIANIRGTGAAELTQIFSYSLKKEHDENVFSASSGQVKIFKSKKESEEIPHHAIVKTITISSEKPGLRCLVIDVTACTWA